MQTTTTSPSKSPANISKTITPDVTPTDTIDDVKQMIQDKTGIPKPDQQRLLLRGMKLEDSSTISDHGLHLDSYEVHHHTFHLLVPKRRKRR